MTFVVIQTATETPWADYEKVARELGDDAPPGLIVHTAGKTPDGTWRAVGVWESEDAWQRFAAEQIQPAVVRALGEEVAAQGSPPTETFESLHTVSASRG